MEDNLNNILDEFEQPQQKLPNAQVAFILGIVSIVPGCMCCLGFILGIVGLILGHNAVKEYENNPGHYYETDYKSAKNGRTLSIIGLVLTLIQTILSFVFNLGAMIMDGNF